LTALLAVVSPISTSIGTITSPVFAPSFTLKSVTAIGATQRPDASRINQQLEIR
jgi:hypothetical protein